MKPSKQLIGRTLKCGLKVTSFAKRSNDHTGGHYSESYIAKDESGRSYFVKAMDYHDALRSALPSQMLKSIADRIEFERKVTDRCKDHKLRRVAIPLRHDNLNIGTDAGSIVEYFVYDLADGDLRAHLDQAGHMDTEWAFRTLHQIALGIKELHGVMISHQDIKPSNIIVYGEFGPKLTDLGKSVAVDIESPHDQLDCVGTADYAPPDLRYLHEHRHGWLDKRLGCDAYLFGSMIVFMFARVSMTALVERSTLPQFRHGVWSGSFGEVLPYLELAYAEALFRFAPHVPSRYRQSVVEAVTELCQPDPAKRCLPRNTSADQYSMERYVSLFDRLARWSHVFGDS